MNLRFNNYKVEKLSTASKTLNVFKALFLVESFFKLCVAVRPIANTYILLKTFLGIFVLKQVFVWLFINNIPLFKMVDNKRLV